MSRSPGTNKKPLTGVSIVAIKCELTRTCILRCNVGRQIVTRRSGSQIDGEMPERDEHVTGFPSLLPQHRVVFHLPSIYLQRADAFRSIGQSAWQASISPFERLLQDEAAI